MRIDKILGNLGYGTRSEIKKFCRQGMVSVNGKEIKKSDTHVDPEKDEITFNGEPVRYREFIYLMLNKPAGYISATFDRYDLTIMELIDDEYLVFEPFPVGRLDKDTEGLLVLTNDGQLAHRVLSPKKHVPKKYYAVISGEVGSDDVKKFEEGLDLGDFVTKPAKLEILGEFEGDLEDILFDFGDEEDIQQSESTERDESEDMEDEILSEIEVTISEGKFHQVKRMFEAVGKKVIYLKRIEMGNLKLDKSLPLGSYRELTEEELGLLEGK